MPDALEGWVTLDYPMEALNRTYHSVWSDAKRGAFGPVQRVGGKIHVERAKVDALVRRLAAEQGIRAGFMPSMSSATTANQPTDWLERLGATLHDQITAAHRTGCIASAQTERTTILQTMRGDAAEAEQRGDGVIAAEIRLAVEQLEAGEYVFDVPSGRWHFRIVTPDGVLVPAPHQSA